jgi:hypothetical protein
LFGGLAGHGHDRADLLGGDPRRLTRARGIAEALLEPQFGQRDRLEERPASPPEAYHVAADPKGVGDGGVALPVGGLQDDPGSEDQLLRGRVSPDEGLEGLALLVGQFDRPGIGATHDRLRGRQQDAGSRQVRQRLYRRLTYAGAH